MTDDLPETIYDPTRMTVGIVTYDEEMATIRWINLRRPNISQAVGNATEGTIPVDGLRARLDDEYFLSNDDILDRWLRLHGND